MSLHALKLAEALTRLTTLDLRGRVDGSTGPYVPFTIGELRAMQTALSAYLTSDEHTIDVQRARASALGFQGLAGDLNERVKK